MRGHDEAGAVHLSEQLHLPQAQRVVRSLQLEPHHAHPRLGHAAADLWA